MNLSMPTINRILKYLISKEVNLVEFQGSRKTGGYVITEKGNFKSITLWIRTTQFIFTTMVRTGYSNETSLSTKESQMC